MPVQSPIECRGKLLQLFLGLHLVAVGLLYSVLRVLLVIMVGSRRSSMRVVGLLWALQVDDGDGGVDVASVLLFRKAVLLAES